MNPIHNNSLLQKLWRRYESRRAALKNSDPQAARKGQRGMTLVEIMVVVVIISMVAGVVGVAVFNALTKAQIETARTQMKQIADSLELYRLSNRRYPNTGDGLGALTQSIGGNPPTMKQVPKDPWGNDYVYIFPGQRNPGEFDLMSYGPDGAQGGGDDIIHGHTETQ